MKVTPDRCIDVALLFQRLIVVSKAGELCLGDVMDCELWPFPPALFEAQTFLWNADKPPSPERMEKLMVQLLGLMLTSLFCIILHLQLPLMDTSLDRPSRIILIRDVPVTCIRLWASQPKQEFHGKKDKHYQATTDKHDFSRNGGKWLPSGACTRKSWCRNCQRLPQRHQWQNPQYYLEKIPNSLYYSFIMLIRKVKDFTSDQTNQRLMMIQKFRTLQRWKKSLEVKYVLSCYLSMPRLDIPDFRCQEEGSFPESGEWWRGTQYSSTVPINSHYHIKQQRK